ncbi:hypothetical protein ACFL07_00950 [Pseudomonadota bacterium]
MHPSKLSDLLLEQQPETNSFSPKLVHCYADLMLKLAAQSGKRHKQAGRNKIPNDAMALHCRSLQESFGIGGFKQINDVAGCVDHTDSWSVDKGETRAYWLNLRGKQLFEKSRNKALRGTDNLLLNKQGNSISKRSNGVYTARDGKGRNAVTTAELEWAVPVDLDAIGLVLEIGVDSIFPNVDAGRFARTDISLRAIHSCALNDTLGRGKIPQTYKESESGRLYGNGELSLQSVTREAKRVALHGAHEYDFSNCHFRLLAHAASQSRIDIPVISNYLNDTTAFRHDLARELDVTYEQAKKVLLATLYGATQRVWVECAIPALIGPEKAECLYKWPCFTDLTFEILEVGDVMRKNAPRLPNGAIINCRGKARHGTPIQELAHLLQGLEAELLHIVIKEYGKDILIIQHDGFALADYVDPAAIGTILSDRTGIDMPVTYEQLTLPGLS